MSARWTYICENDGPVPEVPELVMAGFDENRKALELSDHSHPGSYEFVFIEKGRASWEVNGEAYDTRAGDVFHSKPGERHRGKHEVIEPSRFWWVIVKEPKRSGWLGLRSGEVRLFADAFRTMPRVNGTGPLPAGPFRKLRQSLMGAGAFRSISVRQSLVELLLTLAAPDQRPAAVPLDLAGRIGELTARLAADPAWRPAVRELAAYAGVSESHFYRVFLAHTGISPIDYAERVRMREACRRLTETADSVTVIAHELGYTSSQHFSTVFKRFTRTTPTGWRRGGGERSRVPE